jgi:hypothetical protein
MVKLMKLKEQANLWAPHPSGEFNLATSNTTIATNTPALVVGEHKTSYTFYCDTITPFGRGWIRCDFLMPLEGE